MTKHTIRVPLLLSPEELSQIDKYRSVTGETRNGAIRRLLNSLLKPEYQLKRDDK